MLPENRRLTRPRAGGSMRAMTSMNDQGEGRTLGDAWSLEAAGDGVVLRDIRGRNFGISLGDADSLKPVHDALVEGDVRGTARLAIHGGPLAAAFALGRATSDAWASVDVASVISVRVDTSSEAVPPQGGVGVPLPAVASEAGDLTEDSAVFATAEESEAPREPIDSAPFAKRLADVTRLTVWHGPGSTETLRALAAAKAHPEAPTNIDDVLERALARGRRQRAELDELEAVAKRMAPGAPELLALQARFVSDFPEARAAADKALRFGATVWARNHQAPSRVVLRPGPSHRLTDLSPAKRWRVFIDETGDFAGSAGKMGRVVAVVLGDKCMVKPLARGWHSADRLDDDLDHAMQGLLSADHLGVLGLTVTAADIAIGDAWIATVLETLHWVLRLLPIAAGQPVRVDVQVEARGDYRSSAEWTVATYQLLRELHLRAPGRFDSLTLDLDVAPKRALDAQHPWSDLVAHTWAGRSDASRARLGASELRAACLIEGDAAVVKRAWDELDARGRLEGDTWRAALAEPSAASPRSVLSGLLTRLGAACSKDPVLWGRYLEACGTHLDGKAVDIARLGREVDWLTAHQPANAKPLPAPLELAWLTARLEAANHVGAVADADTDRLEQLSAALYDEHAGLVCQADLDRAVRATNRFAFEEASRRLARWVSVPKAVPGLQFWGRVQSSFGQHAAFRGDFDEAELFFVEALGAFERLSDVTTGRLEASQTIAYRAIAAMDAPGADPSHVRDLVACLRSVDLSTLESIGRDGAPASKYAHHVILRWLAQHGTEPERRAYLRGRTKWAQGHGHPWSLIAAYRAVILQQAGGLLSEVQRQWILATSDALAAGQGAVIRFIGLVLAHASRAAGANVDHDLSMIERELRPALPLAPWLDLETALHDGCDPLALMRRVLPFNFR